MKVEKRLLEILKVPFALGIILVTWAAAFRLVTHSNLAGIVLLDDSELTALLFGASSLALFGISFLVAVFAILGGQFIRDQIDKKVEEVTRVQIELLKIEMRGRVATTPGYMAGELSLSDFMKVDDRERMEEAVALCQQGYDLLKKVGGPAEFLGLNNLLYYSCAHDRDVKSEFLLKNAPRLLEAGQEHGAINLQLTACRVILRYSRDPRQRQQAIYVLRRIASAGQRRVTEKERREATVYLRTYIGELAEMSPAMAVPGRWTRLVEWFKTLTGATK